MKVLDEALIQLNVEVSTSTEAIEFMAKILYENGYVKEGYAEQVVEREKQFPTGLIGKGIGIAIPHTTADYALKPAVCVLIPRNPVTFNMMGAEGESVPAELIMPLVIKEKDMQLNMLKKMMVLLQDVEKLENIYSCRNKKEILSMLAFLEED
jgi:galactitol PTS system EIIA component